MKKFTLTTNRKTALVVGLLAQTLSAQAFASDRATFPDMLPLLALDGPVVRGAISDTLERLGASPMSDFQSKEQIYDRTLSARADRTPVPELPRVDAYVGGAASFKVGNMLFQCGNDDAATRERIRQAVEEFIRNRLQTTSPIDILGLGVTTQLYNERVFERRDDSVDGWKSRRLDAFVSCQTPAEVKSFFESLHRSFYDDANQPASSQPQRSRRRRDNSQDNHLVSFPILIRAMESGPDVKQGSVTTSNRILSVLETRQRVAAILRASDVSQVPSHYNYESEEHTFSFEFENGLKGSCGGLIARRLTGDRRNPVAHGSLGELSCALNFTGVSTSITYYPDGRHEVSRR